MRSKIFHTFVWIVGFFTFTVLSFTFIGLIGFEPVIENYVEANIDSSGVSHSVTAILLNFRALDTLLEVGVIFLAIVLFYTITPHFAYKPLSFESGVTNTFVSLLFPIIVFSSFYILYIGSYTSGGAFGAAALLAGGFIIVRLIKPTYLSNLKDRNLRLMYASGFLFFTLVGIGALFFGSFLYYKDTLATIVILSVETVLMLSLSAILSSFFINATQRLK
ncbi:MAG: MnhB domain-containing protein [Campylobacterales bacterium]